ncbi:unnamed protein product [Lactuca saligna]|uniref:HhH-GPD domain-containing protein n=1 Tax=Lactuca saligna TaxID=75948 RepID=A0AA35YFS0_LACSI|nr:unnamed protein product [Lactuca saligna]
MNFERGFPFTKHGNGDTWNAVARGMPIPRESETVCNEDSLTATAGGNADTTEGANGIVQRANDWKPATHGTSFPHRNNSWTPVTPDKLRSVDMQEKESGTDNWQDLIGMYTGLLKEETVDNTKKRTLSTSPVQNQDATSVSYFLSSDPANWKCNHLASIVCSKSTYEAQNYGIHLSNRPRVLQVESNTSKRSTSSTSSRGTRKTPKLAFIADEHTSKGGATSSTITDSVPLAPITPAKHNDSQHVPENVSSPTNGDSPPSAVSTTHKEHVVPEDKEQGVDLSKTPQQKTPTRRKKHRPRVIKPKKPNKDQKDSTTPGETRVKRKYVRRKGVANSETQQKTPGVSVGKRKYVRKKNIDKTKGQQQNTVVEDTPVKSCRKQLNFDFGINLNVNPQDIEQERNINGNKYTSLPVLNVPIPKTTHHAINVLARNMNMSPRENGYHIVPANLQKMQQSISLDERRGNKRQNSAMDSLFLYQKLLLGVAHRAHDRNIFLENNKKIKIQSEFQEPSTQMNGIYGNGSMMQLLHPYGQKVNPTTTNVINSQYPPESLQFHTQGHVIGWNQPPPIPPKEGIRYGVITYPATLLEKKQRALSGWRVERDEVSVEYVTYKLQHMHIYDEKKKRENELVLYRGSNAIVPFEPIKKKSQRPKVDLDPETDRLWRLLMGKEGSEGGGGGDGGGENLEKDKEKWWENERRVFRGRADSFIARMHLVQGDRRFSRWKGSVVDSVIGVFLTQNVSDHLSSSAFMALAAKFPLKTSFQDGGCEKPIEVAEEKDSIKCQEDIKEPATEDSFKSSTVQIVDEIRSSSGSNSEAEDLTAAHGENGAQKQEAEDLTTENGAQKQESAILKEIPMKVEENSKEQNVSQEPSSREGANTSTSGSNSEAEDLTTAHDENGTQKQETDNLTTSHDENDAKTQESAILEGMPIKVEENSKEQNVSQEPPNEAGANTSSSGSNSEAEDLKTAHGENSAQKQESASLEGIPIKVKANSKEQNVSQESTNGTGANTSKEKKRIADDERNIAMNWDNLRKQAMSNGEKKDQSTDASDSLDYEAFRHAPVNEISDAIKERGMNNLLAERMQNFLNRLVRDHGKIDLEWLRDAPPEKAKEYLLSFRGLGLKSVECVRLLTLHHLAFPVDTNVGRIAVRLGWVPLQPLPESLQLHLLEMYPVLDSIQKYLWPRLCKLDQLTLYELHYQMITFGKVFCTKSKPNCNACPMRAECRHFASAFASARLALPGPEEKKIVASNASIPTDPVPHVVITHMPLPEAENKSEGGFEKKCEPIIEEPTTPEPEATELSLSDIEEQYYEDSDEIPTIKLNMEEFTTNLQSIMQDKKLLQDDMSKALVALNPNAAYIPTPKLKDVSRLRTEHQVYELPDSHRLLEGLEKREPDDPSPYLLAIWTPGETANSIQPPERECCAQESGRLCDKTTCFSCNSIKEANSQVVRGTILIPCRTAMRGSFPLNGTYFQVNEMFADHASSLNPIDVPRAWIWNLPRRTVYFGTSVSTIFRGLSTQGIQYCFWKGFVCVRGFDRKTRAPRPLMARLHFPASKLIKIKNEAK